MAARELDEADVRRLIAADPWSVRALELVRSLKLPDAWIVAGFLRCKVWDMLHGHSLPTPPGDIDVVFFDRDLPPAEDRRIEARLRQLDDAYPWEVYNQAHMHGFNHHAPYTGTVDAFSRWAETVSTIGIRLAERGLEIAAPHGIEDLVRMRIRPTPHPDANRRIFVERLLSKGWLIRWPRARLVLG